MSSKADLWLQLTRETAAASWVFSSRQRPSEADVSLTDKDRAMGADCLGEFSHFLVLSARRRVGLRSAADHSFQQTPDVNRSREVRL